MGNPYLILGIRENVSDEEVSEAYHRGLRQFPPEDHPAEFSVISEAYEAIRNETARTDLHLFGPVLEPVDLLELVGNEPPEVPDRSRKIWQKTASEHWLIGRVS